MYTLIIFIALYVIIAYIHILNSKKFDTLIGILISLAVVYGITIAIGRATLNTKNKEISYYDLPIVSLTLNKDYKMNGSFILGTGGVYGKSIDSYITYGKFKGGLKRIKIDAYNTYIEETNDKSPVIKNYFMIEKIKSYKSEWFWNKNEEKHWYTYDDQQVICNCNYPSLVLVVPENTIYKEFNIKE